MKQAIGSLVLGLALFATQACVAEVDAVDAVDTAGEVETVDGKVAVKESKQALSFWPGHYIAINGWVQMYPSANAVCLLESVQGQLGGWSTDARIYNDGTYYWLHAGPGVTAGAVCNYWAAFSGPGVSTSVWTSSTDPWWAQTSIDAQGNTGVVTQTLWGGNAACFLARMAGNWRGGNAGASSNYAQRGNGADIGWDPFSEAWFHRAASNGPGLRSEANCFAFPSRSYIAQGTYTLRRSQGANRALPSAATHLCGLQSVEGNFDTSSDLVRITRDANNAQWLEIRGNGPAYVDVNCMAYTQP